MYIINNASDLLKAMRECLFTIELKDEFLEVKQSCWIDDELAVLIKTHKTDLINILKHEAGNRNS